MPPVHGEYIHIEAMVEDEDKDLARMLNNNYPINANQCHQLIM